MEAWTSTCRNTTRRDTQDARRLDAPLARPSSGAQPASGGAVADSRSTWSPATDTALVYIGKVRWSGLFRDMTVRETARHPAFHRARAFSRRRERQAGHTRHYIAKTSTTSSRPARQRRQRQGLTIWCTILPSPCPRRADLAVLRAHRPPLPGRHLFRYPQPADTMALSLPALAATVPGRDAAAALRVRFQYCRAALGTDRNRTARRSAFPPLTLPYQCRAAAPPCARRCHAPRSPSQRPRPGRRPRRAT